MSDQTIILELRFGALSASIEDQLSQQKLALPGALAQQFQADVEAVQRLRFGGALTNADARKAENRIFKAISRKARRQGDGE